MIQKIDFHIPELEAMKIYPSALYAIGNVSLLHRPKISIVGTRKPLPVTKILTQEIARKLSDLGVCIISGGAMGVDACAHRGAGSANTIMVAGTGLDIRYPTINRQLIADIERHGLVLSQFEAKNPSNKWNFPLRNELIVALGDVLIVTQADLKSGSMHSVQFALKMKKPIYVLPHRIGESEGTNKLLEEGLAKPIYSIDAFVASFGVLKEVKKDSFLEYCRTSPLYQEAVERYGQKVYEYEFLGKISVESGRVKCL